MIRWCYQSNSCTWIIIIYTCTLIHLVIWFFLFFLFLCLLCRAENLCTCNCFQLYTGNEINGQRKDMHVCMPFLKFGKTGVGRIKIWIFFQELCTKEIFALLCSVFCYLYFFYTNPIYIVTWILYSWMLT